MEMLPTTDARAVLQLNYTIYRLPPISIIYLQNIYPKTPQ